MPRWSPRDPPVGLLELLDDVKQDDADEIAELINKDDDCGSFFGS